jgi:hypothetical protein
LQKIACQHAPTDVRYPIVYPQIVNVQEYFQTKNSPLLSTANAFSRINLNFVSAR